MVAGVSRTWSSSSPKPTGADVMVLAHQSRPLEVNGAVVKGKRLTSRKPNAKLVLTGCFAEIEPGKAASLGVDCRSNQNKDLLVRTLEEELDTLVMPEAATTPESEALFQAHRTRAFIRCQMAAATMYCIVTVARGTERSRTIPDVLKEVQAPTAKANKRLWSRRTHWWIWARHWCEPKNADRSACRGNANTTDPSRLA